MAIGDPGRWCVTLRTTNPDPRGGLIASVFIPQAGERNYGESFFAERVTAGTQDWGLARLDNTPVIQTPDTEFFPDVLWDDILTGNDLATVRGFASSYFGSDYSYQAQGEIEQGRTGLGNNISPGDRSLRSFVTRFLIYLGHNVPQL